MKRNRGIMSFWLYRKIICDIAKFPVLQFSVWDRFHFWLITDNAGKVVTTLQNAMKMHPRHSRIITRKQRVFVNNVNSNLQGIKHNFPTAYKHFKLSYKEI